MKYRFKVIILIAAVLCLSMAAVSSAIRYEDRYFNAVMQDDPNLYMKFDHLRPMDYSRKPYAFVGYVRADMTEGEPNEVTKIANGGGIGKSLLLDGSLYIGTGPHQDSGAYAYNTRHGLGSASQYEFYANTCAFDPRNPNTTNQGADLSFEFWYKNNPPEEPQSDDICYFFQQFAAYQRAPIAPGVGMATGQIRVATGPKFWYTGVQGDADYEDWHHVVTTYDEVWGGINANTMKVQFYYDGSLIGEEVVANEGLNIAADPGFEAAGLPDWSAYSVDATPPTIERTTSPTPLYGSYIARVYDRNDANDGIKQSMLGKMENGWTYRISFIARIGVIPDPCDTVNVFVIQTDDAGTRRIDVTTGEALKDWTQIPGAWGSGIDITGANFTLNAVGTLTQLDLVVAGPQSGAELYLDGQHSTTALTGLKCVWAQRGRLGVEHVCIKIGSGNGRGFTYQCFSGFMDEFAIYNGILPADRVLAHYDAFQPQSCEEIWERGVPDGGWDRDGMPSGPMHRDWFRGQGVGLRADLDQDCYVDLADFAIFAIDWAKCNAPGESGCVENW